MYEPGRFALRSGLSTALLVLAFAACSGSDDGGGGSSNVPARSETCIAWQDRMCDHAADKCSELPRPDCDSVFQSLFCEDDATMQTCIDTLGTATCTGSFPAQCVQINDAQPAFDYCTKLVEGLCARAIECDPSAGSQQDCVAQSVPELCNGAVGVKSTGDQCLADIPKIECTEQLTLPESCQGVITTIESDSASAPASFGRRWLPGGLRQQSKTALGLAQGTR